MAKWADVRVLYLRELRSALRERSIVVNSILLPIFLYPLLLWLAYTGMSFVGGQTEGFSSRVSLKNLPAQFSSLRFALERDKRMTLAESQGPSEDIQNGSLDLSVEFIPGNPDQGAVPEHYQVRLSYDKSKDRSVMARDRFVETLRLYRNFFLEQQAKNIGVSSADYQSFWIDTRDVATGRQLGQFIMGLLLPMLMIIMLSVGCMHPAIDATAGEREKGTWETLMTTATGRANIILSKYLYVASMAAVSGTLNVLAMTLSMRAVLAPILGEQSRELSFQIAWGAIPLILLLTVLLALFVAAGMMTLASFARTFKEGQSMVSPFYLAIFLPVMFLQVPDLEFTPGLALIPVVNVAMVFREAIAGVFHWQLIGITILVESACIALALWLAASILRYEDFLMGSYGGSLGRFIKERLLARKPNLGAHR